MAVTKGSCEVCGSSDNLATYDNGSVWCFTPDCRSNKERTRGFLNKELDVKNNNSELLLGQHSAIPIRRLSQKTCEFFNYAVGVHKGRSVQIASYGKGQKIRFRLVCSIVVFNGTDLDDYSFIPSNIDTSFVISDQQLFYFNKYKQKTVRIECGLTTLENIKSSYQPSSTHRILDTAEVNSLCLLLDNFDPKLKQFYWLGKDEGKLFGKHKWSGHGNSIIITEGEIDALSIAEAQDCKWPVVSLPNGAASARKTLQAELDWLLGYKSIIICFDSDDPGKAAVESVVDLFPAGRLKIASLSEKDANDCLVKGKFEELAKLVFNAAEYRPDGIIWGDEIDVDELFRKQPRGLSLPYPALDDAIRGLKDGRIYTIYAGTGNGKSTSMREIALHVRKNHPEIKIANIFLEESLGFTALSYMAMEHNIPAYKIEENPNLLTSEQKESGKKIISDMGFYKHFGSLDSKHLFNLLDYVVLGKGVKLIMLDHISLLVSGMRSESGEGERRDIDMLVTNLRSFCERTRAIIVDATQLKRKEKSYSKGGEITESDARGSGAIEHISDVVFSLNVNNEESPYDAQIKIIKNRITGWKGNADLISYNPETGRYLPKKIQSSADEEGDMY